MLFVLFPIVAQPAAEGNSQVPPERERTRSNLVLSKNRVAVGQFSHRGVGRKADRGKRGPQWLHAGV